nr:putative integron gene cassette protein [uncultured bacterium]
MKNKMHFSARVIFILLMVMVWVTVFLIWGRENESRDLWGLMFIGAALITFFGFLAIPGSSSESGAFQESRIRLAIAAALIVGYLVYFGSVVYLDPEIDQETGKVIQTFATEMLPTLTNLLTVTISFYFGSTAAIEVAGKLSQKNGSSTKD